MKRDGELRFFWHCPDYVSRERNHKVIHASFLLNCMIPNMGGDVGSEIQMSIPG